MKIKKIAILSFLAISLLTGCSDKEKIDDEVVVKKEKKQEVAQPQLPQFHFKTVDGKDLTIKLTQESWVFEGLEGKVVLLDFFATWCPPCKAEIPHLIHLREELKKDFEVIGIDIGKRGGGLNSQEEMEAFVKQFNITYPVVAGNESRELFSIVRELNKNGSIPFMILFNTKGKYVQYYIGMTPEEMLHNDITATIKSK